MSDPHFLTPFELDVLIACCDAWNYSTNCHQPIEKIIKRINKSAGKTAKKVVKKLVSKGLIIKHPTRGGMTYEPTKEAIKLVRGIEGDFKII